MSKTIKAKCPGCGIILEVTNVNNEPQRQITCPNCGKNLIIPFYMLNKPKVDDNEAKTELNPKPGGGDRTQLGGFQNVMSSCALECNGHRQNLDVGTYRVGRMAHTSQADVQIPTQDGFMSRQHAIITVRRLADGSLKADIRDDQSKNGTRVNNVPLGPGDAIVLHNGDRIQMGETTVIFVATT